MARPIAATPWNASFVSQERTLAWLRTSFADIREIRTAFGGTMNDVVLTMLSEGAARYLRYHNSRPGLPFRIGCPVNVRRDHENGALGNRVSMMFPELPAEPMDPVARLKLVTAETQRIKEAGEPQALDRLMSYGESASPAIVATLAGMVTTAMDAAASLQRYIPAWAKPAAPAPGINFIATNVPGSQLPRYLTGHRMVDYVGLLPLGADLGFGVPIISYNQNLYFTMMAEPKLMPDPDRMKGLVEQVFEELKRAAITQKVRVQEQAPYVKKPKRATAHAAAQMAHHIRSPRERPLIAAARAGSRRSREAAMWKVSSMAQNSRHKILIIGGGTAGLTVAARLRRAGESDVAIIEPSEKHFYQPLWTLVGAGAVRREATARSESDYIAAGVTWIKDWASEISPESKCVATRSGARIAYDFLIVAPGLELNWEAIAGLREAVGDGSVSLIILTRTRPRPGT